MLEPFGPIDEVQQLGLIERAATNADAIGLVGGAARPVAVALAPHADLLVIGRFVNGHIMFLDLIQASIGSTKRGSNALL